MTIKTTKSANPERAAGQWAHELYLTQEAMDAAGLHMHTDERGTVVIRGTQTPSDFLFDAMDNVKASLGLSDADGDELLAHAYNLSLWTAVKRAIK